MRRVLVSPRAIQSDRVTVTDPRQLHHLLHVLRVRVGDALECCDGQGRSYAGQVIHRSSHQLVVKINARILKPRQALHVTLAPSLIKLDRFEWVVQKATELGVDRIVPVVTARTIVRPSLAQAERRLERWRRIIRQAAQQCGRPSVPDIEPPQPFARFIAGVNRAASRLVMPTLARTTVALQEGVAGVAEAGSVIIAIGPEGDFTPEEVDSAARQGAALVSLGLLTLRSETAAIATLAIVRYASGNL